LKYYQQLSNASIDVKISETSLTQLAKANIFKMSDLFTSLGSGTGDSGSFAFLAETMSSKGTTTSANRLIIQQAFADTASIADPTIQAYMQFISSLVMTNHLLASAVGADGKLTASDIVQNPTACIATNGICVDGSSPCDKPPVSSLDDTQAPDVTDLSTSSNWNTAPSITKIIKAADAANTASGTLFGGGTGGGLGSIFKDIIDNAGASECQKRYGIVFALFSGN